MPDPAAWSTVLERAAAEPDTAPLEICRACTEHLQVSGAGVSVASANGSRAIVCATDARAARIEDLQFTLGVGPCLEAVDRGTAVLVPDLREPTGLAVDRWPGFLAAADEAGVRAIFALPLRVGAVRIGAIDLYRDEPGPMSPPDLEAAWQAAGFIGAALMDANLPPGAGELPWPTHTLGMQVHQATGMVQVQLEVPVKQALLALRARAFADGRSLADVAGDVVTRRLRFTREEPT